ncbi:MAG TPA: PRC-barrel domain-containing protein [Rhizomicrobium sp.]|jgi:hypothetical protein|nr:PRC-barrel domain-containing protein [Rhizomicrobium sp.]
MKLRTLTLGGVAIAGLLLAASPSLAQQSVYDTNPTPAERQQTDQLNNDAANQAHGNADANAAANSQYNAANADYEAKQQAYERDRARFRADSAAYAHRWDAFYGHDQFRDVLAMPSSDLIGLSVDTRGGNRVGRIRDVDTNGAGGVTRIAIGTGGGRIAWVDADDIRYDPDTRAVLVDLTRDQIDGLSHVEHTRF